MKRDPVGRFWPHEFSRGIQFGIQCRWTFWNFLCDWIHQSYDNVSKQNSSLKKDTTLKFTVRFLEWARFNISSIVEKLDPEDRAEFEHGKIPGNLFEQVKAAWSDHLNNCLPGGEHLAVWKSALPDPKDYDRFANGPVHLFSKLPKRIRDAVIKAERKREKEIHDEFFASGGDTWIQQLLKVVQSQRMAHRKLMIQALGYKRKESGGASIGETPIDLEHMLLTEAEATGSAMLVGHLLTYIKSLWETEKAILVRKPGAKAAKSLAEWQDGFEHRVIPNPDRSEPRLNRFLIKLGRALADKSKRRVLPDWLHMNQTIRFVVEGWCERITVDGEPWPILCLLSTPALAKFLSLCNPPRWQANRDPRTLERAIQRHGLVRIQRNKITRVEKKHGRVHLS